MAKQRSGLHKQVSHIFDGVPVPDSQNKDNIRRDKPRPEVPKPPDYASSGSSPNDKPSSFNNANTAVAEQKPQLKMNKEPDPAPISPETYKPDLDQSPKSGFSESVFVVQVKKWFVEKVLTPKPGVNPQKHKMMLILTPFLAVAFVVMIYNALSTGPKSTFKAPDTNNIEAKLSKHIEWQLPDVYPSDLRDPMVAGKVQYTQVTESNPGELVVKGVVISDNPSAVIGDSIVHEGDTIMDAKVIKINNDSVEFEADGKTWTQKVQR
jgi:hypothetical protein